VKSEYRRISYEQRRSDTDGSPKRRKYTVSRSRSWRARDVFGDDKEERARDDAGAESRSSR